MLLVSQKSQGIVSTSSAVTRGLIKPQSSVTGLQGLKLGKELKTNVVPEAQSITKLLFVARRCECFTVIAQTAQICSGQKAWSYSVSVNWTISLIQVEKSKTTEPNAQRPVASS